MKYIPRVKDLLHEQAKFVKYQDGRLWYQIVWTFEDLDNGGRDRRPVIFDFPIPVDDAGGGEFGTIEKPITLMRWARKEIERLNSEAEMIAQAKAEWEQQTPETD